MCVCVCVFITTTGVAGSAGAAPGCSAAVLSPPHTHSPQKPHGRLPRLHRRRDTRLGSQRLPREKTTQTTQHTMHAHLHLYWAGVAGTNAPVVCILLQ